MSTLSGVRHTVRSTAARTRRTLLWTPQRYRLTIAAGVAFLVLVPVASLLVRQPWDRIATGAAAGPATVGDGLSGTLPTAGATVPAVPGTAPSASAGAGTATQPADGEGVAAPGGGPLDAAPLPVPAVLAVSATGPLPSRSAGGGQTLSPGAATDRWKAQARTAAVRFSQAWLAGATAARVDTWLTTLDPWLDPGSRDLVALTNLAQIPRTTAVSVQLMTLAESDATAQVLLGDGGRIDLDLVWDGESWRVTSYEPVPAAAVSAPAVAPSGTPSAAGASSGAAASGTAPAQSPGAGGTP